MGNYTDSLRWTSGEKKSHAENIGNEESKRKNNKFQMTVSRREKEKTKGNNHSQYIMLYKKCHQLNKVVSSQNMLLHILWGILR